VAPGGLILASRSPQRRAILTQLGVAFDVVVPDVPELDSGPAAEVAAENAYRKAAAVAAGAPDALVLAVDTVVSLGPHLFGKPADLGAARGMLQALSGRRHAVIGGMCLLRDGRPRTSVSTTLVDFRRLEDALLDWYLAAGEWRERAGGYAIQGRGAALVEAIEGDYWNVVGLPLATLLALEPGLLTEP
jgi:septum formation protein